MTDTTTIRVGGTDAAVRPTAGEGWRLRPRHLLVVPGLAIAILANEVGKANGVGILFLVAFGIAPDLPRLFGLTRHGMGGPTVLVFNVLHHPVAALSAVVVAAVGTVATGLLPMIWLVAALVWLSHVVIGWAVGDVRRRGSAAHA